MQRYFYRSSKLSSIDPKHEDLSTRGGDEQVVLARVEIKPCYLAFANDKLCQRLYAYFVVLDLNQLELHDVRRFEAEYPNRGKIFLRRLTLGVKSLAEGLLNVR